MTRDLKSEDQARAAFWREAHPDVRACRIRGLPQNRYPAYVREAWVNWIDAAVHAGRMGQRLSEKVTL